MSTPVWETTEWLAEVGRVDDCERNGRAWGWIFGSIYGAWHDCGWHQHRTTKDDAVLLWGAHVGTCTYQGAHT
jgi:hypothetical protein